MHHPKRFHTVTPSRAPRDLFFMHSARLALFGLSALLMPFAASAQGLRPIHLRVAGHELHCQTDPVGDDDEIYVPLEVLSAVGAEGKVNRRGDAVRVMLTATRHQEELALARPRGEAMVALSDLARLLNADVLRAVNNNGSIHVDPKGDVAYLLARVTDTHLENGALRVTTSFPVPFQAHMITDSTLRRAYVDLIGAEAPEAFRPSPVPDAETRVKRLRAAQYDIETARVVLELAAGARLRVADAPANHDLTAIMPIDTSSTRIATAPPHDPNAGGQQDAQPLDPGERVAHNKTVEDASNDGALPMPPMPPTPIPVSPTAKPAVTPIRGTVAFRRAIGHRGFNAPPIEVRGLNFVSAGETRARLDIATSGGASAYVHYDATNKLIVDIPNAMLHLPDSTNCEQTFSHPLLTGLKAELAQDSPPLTRLTLDTSRVIGFTLNNTSNGLSLDLRLPRNATGALADKVIVVDPGHGGTSTGATGGGIYEKNITLAISLKLREALEACGAKVIMTRDRDVNVALDDRPRLANSINADFFISIHNDSNGSPNSATGTSTYYHMRDGSCRALAACVHRCIMACSGIGSRGVLSDSVMYASGFAVLRESQMPAILVEVAYINNAWDRQHLVNGDFQQRIAHAICDGLRTYIEGSPRSARHRDGEGVVIPPPLPDDASAMPKDDADTH